MVQLWFLVEFLGDSLLLMYPIVVCCCVHAQFLLVYSTLSLLSTDRCLKYWHPPLLATGQRPEHEDRRGCSSSHQPPHTEAPQPAHDGEGDAWVCRPLRSTSVCGTGCCWFHHQRPGCPVVGLAATSWRELGDFFRISKRLWSSLWWLGV